MNYTVYAQSSIRLFADVSFIYPIIYNICQFSFLTLLFIPFLFTHFLHKTNLMRLFPNDLRSLYKTNFFSNVFYCCLSSFSFEIALQRPIYMGLLVDFLYYCCYCLIKPGAQKYLIFFYKFHLYTTSLNFHIQTWWYHIYYVYPISQFVSEENPKTISKI